MQGCSVTMPKEGGAGGQAMAGTEGKQGSNEGGSAKDGSSGEAEAASDPQPPSMQRQVCHIVSQCPMVL